MEQPMRVLHVIGKMDLGGAEAFIMNVYRHIDRTKLQFDFAVHYSGDFAFHEEIESLGGRIYTWQPLTPSSFSGYRAQVRRFFEEHTDYRVVHGHITSVGAVYLHAARTHGIPCLIAHAHSHSADQTLKGTLTGFTQIPLRYIANHFFACSKKAGEWVFGSRAVEDGRVRIIPNAIRADAFAFDSEVRDRVRKNLGVQDRFVIGHIGRLTPAKNHKFLLEIFSCIHRQNSNAVLLIGGGGELEQKIREQITALSLEESVFMLGAVSNTPELMQAMDVFVMPSLYEGLGIALIEAQATGMPCFTSEGEVPLEAGVTDLLTYLPLSKPASFWAEQILSCDLTRERKNRYLEIVRKGFDVRMLAKDLQNFYLKF